MIYDRGVLGWYRAFEITGELADRLRCRSYFCVCGDRYRIVRVTALIAPRYDNGVVILAEAA